MSETWTRDRIETYVTNSYGNVNCITTWGPSNRTVTQSSNFDYSSTTPTSYTHDVQEPPFIPTSFPITIPDTLPVKSLTAEIQTYPDIVVPKYTYEETWCDKVRDKCVIS